MTFPKSINATVYSKNTLPSDELIIANRKLLMDT